MFPLWVSFSEVWDSLCLSMQEMSEEMDLWNSWNQTVEWIGNSTNSLF